MNIRAKNGSRLFVPQGMTEDFNFDLPESCIAQMPVVPRDQARLLYIGTELQDRRVIDLPDLLRVDDLLVMNDTKVIPARLYGQRGEVRAEVLLHKKQDNGAWLAFARPGKRLRVGDVVVFAPDFSGEIIEKHASGEILIRFSAAEADLFAFLHKYGEPPLPPYIKRETGQAKHDEAQYQTIYAAKEGAIAAPTAGLHFTSELLTKLESKGIERVKVTLHVGAGTFLPVKAERLQDHVMHSEWGEITEAQAAIINKAKRAGRRIVSIGTTSLRLLESAADEAGIIHPFQGETDIFITPGYRFLAVDALMTNFHLPKSTLFMLVCAFGGMERMQDAYAHAIAHNYRFYSYGDATLLERG